MTHSQVAMLLFTVVVGAISYLLSTEVLPEQRGIYYHFLVVSVPLIAMTRIFLGRTG